ncbi:MAG: hypothetical protein IJB31_04410 [Akkermansia sp.]|nr:hypothetical protein [Akkermansia sp.]
MPEQEDFNTFSSYDCLGAMLMLSILPVAIAIVLLENIPLAIILGVVGVVLSLGVFLLALLTHWRIIPRIVDILGMILTPTYIGIAVWLWCTM